MTLSRLFHTVRHLLPVQIYGRPLFMLKRMFSSAGSPGRVCQLASELKSKLLLQPEESLELCFLNKTQKFLPASMQWESVNFDEPPEKLWVYHLNYFAWLHDGQTETHSNQNLFLILDWIARNSSERSETWEPYPLSRRITEWVRWCREHPSLDEEALECIRSSIACQCDRLWCDLEYHNQANHLLENLKALFVATSFLAEFEEALTPEIDARLEFCIDELVNQIRLQFLSDGGHFERSPMYHVEMLHAVETARAANRKLLELDGISQNLSRKIARLAMLCGDRVPLMRDWLAVMTHPDGFIAQFNDSALAKGIMRDWQSMSYLLENSGFFVRHTPECYFAMSCGSPSPAFQPGHSHCDILSYELSLAGQRCIIDTGIGSYQNEQVRQECRKTEAHNVPMIEHAQQSDIWGNFRIGQRAKVTHSSYDSENGLLAVEFVDQYGQTFRRETIFSPGSIKIRDRMSNRRVTGTFISLIQDRK
ncbi:MAG: alginate lyase family protein, partial [Candidatus Riflebacteria bacterium]|nr:alginate lyase family protein [Candidatus Riflebacteria bacterium]